jgi:hypothetical protein
VNPFDKILVVVGIVAVVLLDSWNTHDNLQYLQVGSFFCYEGVEAYAMLPYKMNDNYMEQQARRFLLFFFSIIANQRVDQNWDMILGRRVLDCSY